MPYTMTSLTILDMLLALLGLYLVKQLLSTYKKGTGLPLPPGPRPLPIIGNLLDMPSTYQHRTFTEWNDRWGKSLLSTPAQG